MAIILPNVFTSGQMFPVRSRYTIGNLLYFNCHLKSTSMHQLRSASTLKPLVISHQISSYPAYYGGRGLQRNNICLAVTKNSHGSIALFSDYKSLVNSDKLKISHNVYPWTNLALMRPQVNCQSYERSASSSGDQKEHKPSFASKVDTPSKFRTLVGATVVGVSLGVGTYTILWPIK